MDTYGFYEPDREAPRRGHGGLGNVCGSDTRRATRSSTRSTGQRCLELMDITVRRNAYGRQVDSFEADLDFAHLRRHVFRGVFIRAPWIESVGDGVEVLAKHDGKIVAARQGDLHGHRRSIPS